MEDRTVEGIPLNDGGGLMDNLGLIDSLIVDCNEIPRALFDGQNVRFCAIIHGMAQKLTNLKEGVKNDTDALRDRVVELHRLNEKLMLRGEQEDVQC